MSKRLLVLMAAFGVFLVAGGNTMSNSSKDVVKNAAEKREAQIELAINGE